MKKSLVRLTMVLAATALAAGCATDQGMGVQQGASVTRFHLGQPTARGEISVESADPRETNSLELAQIAAPVERELTRLGWSVVRGNARSEQVALIRLDQVGREGGRGSGLSIGVGGGSFGRSSGVGVGVGGTVPLGGAGTIVATELSVRIQRRSDATVAWEGRAQLEARAGSPLADPRAAADRLAWALFQDFPGESGRTIRIR
jgi:hypothetical protein